MNVETVQGYIGKRGGFFKRIGDAFKKGAKTVFRGLAKVNPVLVPARAAFLTMVRNNVGGVAKKLQRAGIDKARRKWENLGGDFAKLQAAVKEGAGAPIKGIGALNIDPELSALLSTIQEAAGSPVRGVGAVPGFMAVLEAAKPILQAILSALGLKLGQAAPGEAVPPEERALVDQLQTVQDSPVTQRIQEATADPGTPNTGAGGGAGGAIPWIPIAIGAGALLLLSSRKRR